MAPPKSNVGEYGENLAKEYLVQKGYTIVAQNWRCKMGELDIVAQAEQKTIFVEVKTRRTVNIEEVYLQYNTKKRDKLVRAIFAYLQAHDMHDVNWRFDMIAIALPYRATPIIEHTEDALEW
jgi:putative endonuclease